MLYRTSRIAWLGAALLAAASCNQLLGNPEPGGLDGEGGEAGSTANGSGGTASSSGGDDGGGSSGGTDDGSGGGTGSGGGSGGGADDGSGGGTGVVPVTCGDGEVQSGEDCDDGDEDNDDICTERCKAPYCGDGFHQSEEACEDGNRINEDSCTAACVPADCGDGYVQPGEDCDDAGTDPADGCSPTCAWDVVQVAAGGYHTCARLSNGQIKCWGGNSVGQLGLGDIEDRGDEPGEMGDDLPTVDLGEGRTARLLAAGFTNTCAVLDDGSAKCWGTNGSGELGLGSSEGVVGDEPDETGDNLPALDLGGDSPIRRLSLGTSHSCVEFEDYSIKCWGHNTFGQLGQGDVEHRGNEPGDMGDDLPFVDLSPGSGSLVVGGYHTCSVADTIRCWGSNGSGELGVGDTEARGDGVDTNGVPLDDMGTNLVSVDLGGSPSGDVDAGMQHSCAVLLDGRVKCWGHNQGRLGIGSTGHRGNGINPMGDDLPDVDLGSDELVNILSVGAYSNCVLFYDDSIKCWGDNANGQLGLGDEELRGDEPEDMGDNLPAVELGDQAAVGLEVGGRHACALLEDATLRCWGNNDRGQLGLGNKSNRGDDPGEMGNALPPVDL